MRSHCGRFCHKHLVGLKPIPQLYLGVEHELVDQAPQGLPSRVPSLAGNHFTLFSENAENVDSTFPSRTTFVLETGLGLEFDDAIDLFVNYVHGTNADYTVHATKVGL